MGCGNAQERIGGKTKLDTQKSDKALRKIKGGKDKRAAISITNDNRKVKSEMKEKLSESDFPDIDAKIQSPPTSEDAELYGAEKKLNKAASIVSDALDKEKKEEEVPKEKTTQPQKTLYYRKHFGDSRK